MLHEFRWRYLRYTQTSWFHRKSEGTFPTIQSSRELFVVPPHLCFFSDNENLSCCTYFSLSYHLSDGSVPCSQSSFLKESPMIIIHKTLSGTQTPDQMLICWCIHFCLRFFPLLQGLKPSPGPPDGVTFPTAPCFLLLSCCQMSAMVLVICRVALAVQLIPTWMSSNGNSHRTAQTLPVSFWDLGGNQVSSRKSETSV